MKVIDQTPFIKENGEIGLMDRGKALMKYGAGFFKEIEAQNSIIEVLEKALDKKYVLLRNITPPGLDTMIPFILVGPTGVFVMSVTALNGTFRARGDQWGTVSGNTFKPEKPNMLTRTDRMARAVQIFLKRQGYADMNGLEAILLCSDPTTHIDSMRPIIRVIMRDALERFAVSIAQARVVLSPESVFDITNRILHPPAPVQPKPVETEAEGATPAEAGQENAPAAVEQENRLSAVTSSGPEPEAAPAPTGASVLPDRDAQAEEVVPDSTAPVRRGIRVTKKQAILLIIMLVVWCLIVAVFVFLIAKDYLPILSK